ncbi:MAG: hypothetical protein QXN15_08700 [Candidatus Jordarchaeales archaeon]|nr:C/D box methylation guide ribonucleoprotein complex aNOP56 subunit [Candidatus Jordarchaeia archaeon]
MNVYLVSCVSAVFALDESGNVLGFSFMPAEAESIADRLYFLQKGEPIPELKEVVESLGKDNTFIVEDRHVGEALKSSLKVNVRVERGNGVARLFRSRLLEYLEKAGIMMSENDLKELTRRVSSILTRRKVREVGSRRDELLIQAVYCLDDVEEVLNLFSIRVREWYSLNFPELTRLLQSHLSFVRIVCELGPKEDVTRNALSVNLNLPSETAESIMSEAARSMGAPILGEDFAPLKELASITLSLFKFRETLRSYIADVMQEIAPNLTSIVGPLVGARLIYLAGGLEKLARLPASKIQVLGAEKALFRSLTIGTPPPKHGVLFRHPEVSGSPWWQRGKVARVLANKIAVAVRADVYTGNYIGDELQRDLEKRIKEIRERFPSPPAEKPKRPKPVKKRR